MRNKLSGIAIIVAVILPFVADHSGLWSAVLGTGMLSTVVLTIYMVVLISIVVWLLVQNTSLEKREKWIWGVALLLAFPLATLFLMYRLHWKPPSTQTG